MLRLLRILRVFRVLKLAEYLQEAQALGGALEHRTKPAARLSARRQMDHQRRETTRLRHRAREACAFGSNLSLILAMREASR